MPHVLSRLAERAVVEGWRQREFSTSSLSPIIKQLDGWIEQHAKRIQRV